MTERSKLHEELNRFTEELTKEVSWRLTYLYQIHVVIDKNLDIQSARKSMAQDIISTYKAKILDIGASAFTEFLDAHFNNRFMEAMTCLGCMSIDAEEYTECIKLMDLALTKSPDTEREFMLHMNMADSYYKLSEEDPTYLSFCINKLPKALEALLTIFIENPNKEVIYDYFYKNSIPTQILVDAFFEMSAKEDRDVISCLAAQTYASKLLGWTQYKDQFLQTIYQPASISEKLRLFIENHIIEDSEATE